MKREDLKGLNLPDEAIDSIMALHGKDIESHKTKLVTLQTEVDGLKGQLTEAGAQIEKFKVMDVDGIKAAADDWKLKAEKAQTDAAAQLQSLKFDHALEGALTGAKAKNIKAVQSLLSRDALKFNDADGTIIGLNEQLEKIKSENDYLFQDETPPPTIIKGGNNQSVLKDPQLDAMRKAAGLTS